MTINTSKGAMSSADALALFKKKGALSKGEQTGMFKQLILCSEGKEACDYVLANPSLFDEKMQKLAKERITGKPQGQKVMNDVHDLHDFLRRCGLYAEVKITLCKNNIVGACRLLFLESLELSDHHRVNLQIVGQSREWQGISNVIVGKLKVETPQQFEAAASTFRDAVEKLELLKVLVERPVEKRDPQPISDGVRQILADHPELFFDKDLVVRVCKAQSFGRVLEEVDSLPENPSMEAALLLFFNNGSRIEFLEYYIQEFEAALA